MWTQLIKLITFLGCRRQAHSLPDVGCHRWREDRMDQMPHALHRSQSVLRDSRSAQEESSRQELVKCDREKAIRIRKSCDSSWIKIEDAFYACCSPWNGLEASLLLKTKSNLIYYFSFLRCKVFYDFVIGVLYGRCLIDIDWKIQKVLSLSFSYSYEKNATVISKN